MDTVKHPLYIAMASRLDHVVAYQHCNDHEEARVWCERAREVLFELADQVAIAMPETHGPALAAVEGWVRVGMTWINVPPLALRPEFSVIEPEPTPADELARLLEGQPAKAWPKSPALPTAQLRSIASLLFHVGQGLRELARAARALRDDRLQVLIVDDDPVARRVLHQLLANIHDVTEADGYPAALVKLGTGDFDAIITDQEMGRIGSGLDLLEEARIRWPSTRRVLCTSSVGEVEAAAKAGIAHHLLQKPVDRLAVLASLRAG